jgi:hypothetical protein
VTAPVIRWVQNFLSPSPWMTTYLRRGMVLLVARISAALVLPALGLAALAASAQNAPPSPAISVSTRLVQVGVVVRDKGGPVTDLTKDDFVVLDRGRPQRASLFSVESGRSEDHPVQLLPQNTFSDLPQYRANATRSVTIVLLDNLNTLYGSAPRPYESTPYWFEDFALANAKAPWKSSPPNKTKPAKSFANPPTESILTSRQNNMPLI